MLRRFFIPVLLVLVTIAGALYWLFDSPRPARDVRSSVPVERFTLRNGLRVVVMPNDRIPAVTHILFVRAGGGDDPYGKSGLAHYLEHLMFSGTKNYPEGVYDRTIARFGGEQNAYTTSDYTAYYATVPKEQLKHVMAMEADRLVNLEIDEARAARELQVITEERATRVENRAPSLLAEQIDAVTFLNHPYGRPLIGWAGDMASFTAADARQFFARHYRAANMVLVVAGDVTTRDVRRMAQDYYGALPSAEAPRRHWPQEPPLRLTRRAAMEDEKAREPRLLRQYAAPSAITGDTARAMPLSLLAQYLGGSSTSLLYRSLVLEQKLASTVSVSYDPLSFGPALLRIWAVPTPGTPLPALEKALDVQLEQVLGALPAKADLARAKTQFKAEMIYAQDGLEPLAHLIGQLYMLGLDEHYFYDWIDAVNAVEATDILEAAQQVLNPAHRVTGYLRPAQTPASPPDADAAEMEEPLP